MIQDRRHALAAYRIAIYMLLKQNGGKLKINVPAGLPEEASVEYNIITDEDRTTIEFRLREETLTK